MAVGLVDGVKEGVGVALNSSPLGGGAAMELARAAAAAEAAACAMAVSRQGEAVMSGRDSSTSCRACGSGMEPSSACACT